MIYYAKLKDGEKRVEIRKEGSTYFGDIEGKAFAVDARLIDGPGVMSLIVDRKCYEAVITKNGKKMIVLIKRRDDSLNKVCRRHGILHHHIVDRREPTAGRFRFRCVLPARESTSAAGLGLDPRRMIDALLRCADDRHLPDDPRYRILDSHACPQNISDAETRRGLRSRAGFIGGARAKLRFVGDDLDVHFRPIV